MKIFIIFAGLIIQVDQSGSWMYTAVFPRKLHTAELVVPIEDLVDADARRMGREEGGHLVVTLVDARVRIKGTRGFRMPKTDAYEDAVPQLKPLAPNCRLRSAVGDRKPDEKISAFVDFRGGRTMTTDTYLQKKLTYAEGDTGWCASCGVQWEADLWGDSVTFAIRRCDAQGCGPAVPLRVHGGAKVLIRNRPQSDGAHYKHVYDIFNGDCHGPVPMADPDQLCDKTNKCQEKTYYWEASMEKVDQEAKPTWPASDCTITDYPQ